MSLAEGRPTRNETLRRHFEALDRNQEKAKLRRAGEAAGECIGDCGGNMANLDCEGLAREKEHIEQAQRDAKMADQAYVDPNARRAPPGYSNATDQDLIDLGILDPETGINELDHSELPGFRGAVFKNNLTQDYVIAFKGTDPTRVADWVQNLGQGGGFETPYYFKAMEIAEVANALQPDRVSFVGHSLGGGMASAAARAVNRPATTFNPAGLHRNTVPNMIGNPAINAWHVKGEILSNMQDSRLGRRVMPRVAGRRRPLDPGTDPSFLKRYTSPGRGLRSIDLHGMGEVTAALDAKREAIEELQEMKGCPV